ncbi:MAG: hypothetical protein HYV63_03895 [Candidatus Schekmanbacteria bacterium]|nr:hypothetical protein [Candidatus Schekmanbacteria bacterium]
MRTSRTSAAFARLLLLAAGAVFCAAAPPAGAADWSSIPFTVQRAGEWSSHFHDVDFAPSGTSGWIVGSRTSQWLLNSFSSLGEDALILRSTDRGNSWNAQVSGLDGDLEAVFAYDDTTAYAIGDALLKTTNGGVTWVTVAATGLQFPCRDLWLPVAGTLYAACAGAVYTSADDGETFLPAAGAEDAELRFEALYFTDQSHGWAGAVPVDGTLPTPRYSVYRTVDGTNWDVIELVDAEAIHRDTASSLLFLDELTGFLVGHGIASRTTDGGGTFQPITSFSPALDMVSANPIDVHFAADDRFGMMIFPLLGAVYTTGDAGVTWAKAARVSPPEPLAGIHVVDTARAIIVGESGVVARSLDAGTSWSLDPRSVAATLKEIDMATAHVGWIVAGDEVLMGTTDGGRTWISRSAEVAAAETGLEAIGTYAQVSAVGTDTVFVWKDKPGRLYRSTNGGQTFTARSDFSSCDNGMDFATAARGWCRGATHIWGTSNGGGDWSREEPFSLGGDIFAYDTANVWAVNDIGRIMKRSGALGWEEVYSDGPKLNDVFFLTASLGVATGDDGGVWTDSGGDKNEWASLAIPGKKHVAVADEQLWLSSSASAVYGSSDAGQNWTVIPRRSGITDVSDITTVDPSRAWLVSSYGLVEFHGSVMPPSELIARAADGPVVHLTWSAPAGETGVDHYNAYRSAIAGGDFQRINAAPIAQTTFEDDAVSLEVSYYYAVTAVDAAGNESGYSEQAFVRASDGVAGRGAGRAAASRRGTVTTLYKPDGTALPAAALQCTVQGETHICCLFDPPRGGYSVDHGIGERISVYSGICPSARTAPPAGGAGLQRAGIMQIAFYRPEEATSALIVEVGPAVRATGEADLSLSQDVTANPGTLGSALQFTVVVANEGPQAADEVTLVDEYGPSFRITGLQTSHGFCEDFGGALTCSLGSVLSGTTATVTVSAIPIAVGAGSNEVSITARQSDPDPSDNSSILPVEVGPGAVPGPGPERLMLLAVALVAMGAGLRLPQATAGSPAKRAQSACRDANSP